jgi:hypothetical protein
MRAVVYHPKVPGEVKGYLEHYDGFSREQFRVR